MHAVEEFAPLAAPQVGREACARSEPQRRWRADSASQPLGQLDSGPVTGLSSSTQVLERVFALSGPCGSSIYIAPEVASA
jgi:hypothetical protein